MNVTGPLWCASMWWRDEKEREAEQFEHCEERWNWRCQCGEKQPDVSSLPCHLRTCLGPQPYSSICLCQCQWSRLPPTALQMFLLWTATRDHVDIQGLCRVGPFHHYDTQESWYMHRRAGHPYRQGRDVAFLASCPLQLERQPEVMRTRELVLPLAGYSIVWANWSSAE